VRIRDRTPLPFRVEVTEQFTSGFERLRQAHPRLEEIVEGLVYLLWRTPRDVGVRATEIADSEVYVYRTRPGSGVPSFRFAYEIKGDVVELFGIGLADRESLT
jgi:hypothetical protein